MDGMTVLRAIQDTQTETTNLLSEMTGTLGRMVQMLDDITKRLAALESARSGDQAVGADPAPPSEEP